MILSSIFAVFARCRSRGLEKSLIKSPQVRLLSSIIRADNEETTALVFVDLPARGRNLESYGTLQTPPLDGGGSVGGVK